MKKLTILFAIFFIVSVFCAAKATENILSDNEILLSEGPGAEKDTLVFSIPNAFIPNGKPQVATFKPGSPEPDKFSEYSIKIFNRWGLLVYESTDPNEGWDGKHKGNLCPVDTYVYVLQYAFWITDSNTGENTTGDVVKTKGTVTLLE